MKLKATILMFVLILLIQTVSAEQQLAGWRSSAYGYQTGSPPSYWINIANDISSKFPSSTPAGIWLVGETDGDGPGTILYMPCTSTTNINCQGSDIAEPYLTAFDNAGIKVILQVEPMNADINTLIDIVMNRYKHHPSVIGFGIDNEWLGSCTDGCKPTASEVISWNNKLHSINPNYILMLKHYDESKLPTGIPSDVLIVCDDEQNGNLNTLVSEHVAMENQYPNNPFGSQYGYPSDSNIWSGMSDPIKQIGTSIQSSIGRPISVFWVDFSIKTVYPPSIWNTPRITPTPTPTVEPIPEPIPTPTATPTPTPEPTVEPTPIPTPLPVPTAATIKIPIKEDTYTSSSSPTKNYGSANYMYAQSGKKAYMKFDTSVIPQTATITKAALVISVSYSSGAGTLTVYPVTSQWSENTLTARTPVTTSSAFTTIKYPKCGNDCWTTNTGFENIVQGWVKDPTTNNGFVAFTTSNVVVEYNSRSTSYPAYLTIEYIDNGQLPAENIVSEEIVGMSPDSSEFLIKRTTVYNKNNAIQKNKVIRTSRERCYDLLGIKWKTFPIKYTINPINSQGIEQSFIVDALSKSTRTWDNATSKRLFGSYTIDPNAPFGIFDGKNTLAFGLNHPNPSVVAVTYTWYYSTSKKIVEFDISFETDYPWGDGTVDPLKMDLRDIATHEIGHGVGLDDLYSLSCIDETMFGYALIGEINKRTLNRGDISGIHALYG